MTGGHTWRFDRILSVADPDPRIRSGGHPDP